MSFRDNFIRVFAALNQADVRYMLVGGLAVSAHGHTRATADIDISLALDQENALRAVHALSEIGYRPTHPVTATDFANPEIRRSWIEDKGMVAFQMGSGNPLDMPIDLLAKESFPFDEVYARAPRAEMLPGLLVPLVPLDVLVDMKRVAGRRRDLDDIESLRSIHPNIRPVGGPDV